MNGGRPARRATPRPSSDHGRARQRRPASPVRPHAAPCESRLLAARLRFRRPSPWCSPEGHLGRKGRPLRQWLSRPVVLPGPTDLLAALRQAAVFQPASKGAKPLFAPGRRRTWTACVAAATQKVDAALKHSPKQEHERSTVWSRPNPGGRGSRTRVLLACTSTHCGIFLLGGRCSRPFSGLTGAPILHPAGLSSRLCITSAESTVDRRFNGIPVTIFEPAAVKWSQSTRRLFSSTRPARSSGVTPQGGLLFGVNKLNRRRAELSCSRSGKTARLARMTRTRLNHRSCRSTLELLWRVTSSVPHAS